MLNYFIPLDLHSFTQHVLIVYHYISITGARHYSPVGTKTSKSLYSGGIFGERRKGGKHRDRQINKISN